MDEPLTPLQKLLGWYSRKNPVELWLQLLRQAEVFEDWEESALHLDNLLGLDHWYVCPALMFRSMQKRTNVSATGEITRHRNTTTGAS